MVNDSTIIWDIDACAQKDDALEVVSEELDEKQLASGFGCNVAGANLKAGIECSSIPRIK